MNADFPAEDRSEILHLLERYDGPEPERVQLAILALSKGNSGLVREYWEWAFFDYRSVVIPIGKVSDRTTG